MPGHKNKHTHACQERERLSGAVQRLELEAAAQAARGAALEAQLADAARAAAAERAEHGLRLGQVVRRLRAHHAQRLEAARCEHAAAAEAGAAEARREGEATAAAAAEAEAEQLKARLGAAEAR